MSHAIRIEDLTEKHISFSGIGYLPLKNKLIGYLQILIGYCLNSYWVTSLFSYICYVTSTILIGYSIIHFLFEKQLGIPEK